MLWNYKRADWRAGDRTIRGKAHVMYNCKERRRGSVDLPSRVGWVGGSVARERIQIQRSCTTEPS